jgi:NAD(P)-dependent dehydrogenase (short-subunit alcohol dehydrogenase family)
MTRFTTHFGFQSTAAEVIVGVDLTGRKAIVTGGSAGVGAETVRALAGAGAAVTMAVRRVDVAEPVAAELRRSAGNQAIDIKALDLSDLRSVKAFTDAWEGLLDILVNNAGIMAVPELEKTPQGFELQFGTNFLGHFLFLMASAVSTSRTATRRSRSQHGPATSRAGMLDVRSIWRMPNGFGIYP